MGRGWEGIHYLLTGIPVDAPNSQDASTPAFWFLRGGLKVGTHKFGRLPCRAFKSGEVSRWCDYLETWNEPRFRARYDLADMKQKAVYPAMFDNGVEKDYSLHYLLGDFGILTAFLGERVTAGDGVILEFQ